MPTMDVRDALGFAKQLKTHYQVFEHTAEVLELVADGEQVAREVAERARVAQDAAEADLKLVAEEKVSLLHDVVALRNERNDAREERAVAVREHIEAKTVLLAEIEGLTATRDALQKEVNAIRASVAQIAGVVGAHAN